MPFGSACYGMTNAGGANGDGTIFSVNPDGTGFTLLHSFAGGLTDGTDPFGSLAQSGDILRHDGRGTGGEGVVFKLNPDGTGLATVHAFAGGANDGKLPLGSPVVSGGVIYGMTMQGGTANVGVVYRVNPDGSGFQVIHSFTGGAADGGNPSFSSLVVSGGVIYGMTPGGGTAGLGAVFKMNADGTGFSVLHSFTATAGDGYGSLSGLTLIGNTLYGMTYQGGGTAWAQSSKSTPTAPVTTGCEVSLVAPVTPAPTQSETTSQSSARASLA